MASAEWAHLRYLEACQAALQAYGVETVGVDVGAEGVRSASLEVLAVGRRGYLEQLDLGWTEEHGWGYSRRVEPASDDFEHGQFGGGVLPEPEEFAALVVRIAVGEEVADQVRLPAERHAYRSARDADDLAARLQAY